MEAKYFIRSYRQSAKVRWLSKLLNISRLVELDQVIEGIDSKIARIALRRGELPDTQLVQVVENLLLAKLNERLMDFRIRSYQPQILKKSPTHAFRENQSDGGYTFKMSACPIYKEQHYGLRNFPTILVPGFVPDGNEAFFLLRKCFIKYGSLYYINYPTKEFSREILFHQLYDIIADINHRKIKNAGKKGSPFLVGTSFGCSIITNFLRWLREEGLLKGLGIQGLVLISPVLCLADVVNPTETRQKTLVGRSIAHLTEVDPGDPEAIAKAMNKARSIFQKMFASGRDRLNFASKDMLPIFAIEDRVLSLFDFDTAEQPGFFYRYLDLKHAQSIAKQFLSDIPTLVLFAEGEHDVLTEDSPTLKTFSNIENLRTIFPNGEVEFVYSKDAERKVTHSDLIFQAERFAEHIGPWLERTTT